MPQSLVGVTEGEIRMGLDMCLIVWLLREYQISWFYAIIVTAIFTLKHSSWLYERNSGEAHIFGAQTGLIWQSALHVAQYCRSIVPPLTEIVI
jgi:hypothetical protein